MHRPLYRVRQFTNGLAPHVTTEERAAVADLLSPEQCSLFHGMNGYGQRHALGVYHALVAAGWSDRELLAVALLHDVAKGRMGLLERTAVVLLRAWAPRLLAWLSADGGSWWRRPFYLDAHHPRLSAQRVERVGGSLAMVELIRRHASPEIGDSRLRALHEADNRN